MKHRVQLTEEERQRNQNLPVGARISFAWAGIKYTCSEFYMDPISGMSHDTKIRRLTEGYLGSDIEILDEEAYFAQMWELNFEPSSRPSVLTDRQKPLAAWLGGWNNVP